MKPKMCSILLLFACIFLKGNIKPWSSLCIESKDQLKKKEKQTDKTIQVFVKHLQQLNNLNKSSIFVGRRVIFSVSFMRCLSR